MEMCLTFCNVVKRTNLWWFHGICDCIHCTRFLCFFSVRGTRYCYGDDSPRHWLQSQTFNYLRCLYCTREVRTMAVSSVDVLKHSLIIVKVFKSCAHRSTYTLCSILTWPGLSCTCRFHDELTWPLASVCGNETIEYIPPHVYSSHSEGVDVIVRPRPCHEPLKVLCALVEKWQWRIANLTCQRCRHTSCWVERVSYSNKFTSTISAKTANSCLLYCHQPQGFERLILIL